MKRTDEAFKKELFRRYEQYKKNRRNLRLLACAPAALCLLICGALLLPDFPLLNLSHKAVEADNIPEPNYYGSGPYASGNYEAPAPGEMNSFVHNHLNYEPVSVAACAIPEDSLLDVKIFQEEAVEQVVDTVDAMMTARSAINQSIVERLEGSIYRIDIFDAGGDTLYFHIFGSYVRYGSGAQYEPTPEHMSDWYAVPEQLTDRLLSLVYGENAPVNRPESPTEPLAILSTEGIFHAKATVLVTPKMTHTELPSDTRTIDQPEELFQLINRLNRVMETPLPADQQAVWSLCQDADYGTYFHYFIAHEESYNPQLSKALNHLAVNGWSNGGFTAELLANRYIRISVDGKTYSDWYMVSSTAATALRNAVYSDEIPDLPPASPFFTMFNNQATLTGLTATLPDGRQTRFTAQTDLSKMELLLCHTYLNGVPQFVPESCSQPIYELKFEYQDGSIRNAEFRGQYYRIDGGNWLETERIDLDTLRLFLSQDSTVESKLFASALENQILQSIMMNTGFSNAVESSELSYAGRLSEIKALLTEFSLKLVPADQQKALTDRMDALLANDHFRDITLNLSQGGYLDFSTFDRFVEFHGIWFEVSEEQIARLESLLTGGKSDEPETTLPEGYENLPYDVDLMKSFFEGHEIHSICTGGAYSNSEMRYVGGGTILAWNNEYAQKLQALIDFMQSLTLTKVPSNSFVSLGSHLMKIEIMYADNNSSSTSSTLYFNDRYLYTDRSIGDLQTDGYYEMPQEQAEKLLELLTEREGFSAADEPLKKLLDGKELAKLEILPVGNDWSSGWVELNAEENADEIERFRQLFTSLSLSDIEGEAFNAAPIQKYMNGYRPISNSYPYVQFMTSDTCYYTLILDENCLYVSLTPGGEYWYQIPESEAAALVAAINVMANEL